MYDGSYNNKWNSRMAGQPYTENGWQDTQQLYLVWCISTCVWNGAVSSKVSIPPDVAGLQPTLHAAPLEHLQLVLSTPVDSRGTQGGSEGRLEMRGEKSMLKWMQQRKAGRDKRVKDVTVSVLQKSGRY
jgi:hypothetical protein